MSIPRCRKCNGKDFDLHTRITPEGERVLSRFCVRCRKRYSKRRFRERLAEWKKQTCEFPGCAVERGSKHWCYGHAKQHTRYGRDGMRPLAHRKTKRS